jgi:hypothetical protein
MRLTLKTVNDELARRGHASALAKGDGYFYFTTGGAATDWLDQTVRVRTINSLTLKQWIEEFRRLESSQTESVERVDSPNGKERTTIAASGQAQMNPGDAAPVV